MRTRRPTPKPPEEFNPLAVVALRENEGLSLAAFGKSLGFTGQYMGLIESGKARPSLKFLHQLSAVYQVSIRSLFRKVGS
jgi:transcriptional regulator with XRE-family HTH domain